MPARLPLVLPPFLPPSPHPRPSPPPPVPPLYRSTYAVYRFPAGAAALGDAPAAFAAVAAIGVATSFSSTLMFTALGSFFNRWGAGGGQREECGTKGWGGGMQVCALALMPSCLCQQSKQSSSPLLMLALMLMLMLMLCWC